MIKSLVKLKVTKESRNCPKCIGAFDEPHFQFYYHKALRNEVGCLLSLVRLQSQTADLRGVFVFKIMRLDEIYTQSDRILSHAERDFYLSFCSFADYETGFTFANILTVAKRCGIQEKSKSSASRMFKKLEKLQFIRKVKGGFLCLIGYNQSSHSVNFSSPDVNFEKIESSPDVNNSSHHVNQSSHSVNLHNKDLTTHITTHKTEEETANAAIPSTESKLPVVKKKSKAEN